MEDEIINDCDKFINILFLTIVDNIRGLQLYVDNNIPYIEIY